MHHAGVIWYVPIQPRILQCLHKQVDDGVQPAPQREWHGVFITSLPHTLGSRQDHLVLKHHTLIVTSISMTYLGKTTLS